MAESACTAARQCVECGSNFRTVQKAGRPRLRCFGCVPKRVYAPRPRAIRTNGACEDCGVVIVAPARGIMPKRCRPCYEKKRVRPPTIGQAFNCEGCGTSFEPKKHDRTRYCSRGCFFAHMRQDKAWLSAHLVSNARRAEAAAAIKPWPHCKVVFNTCRHCEALFAAKKKRRYCVDHSLQADRAADLIAMRPAISGRCEECDTDFVRPNKGKLSARFCSAACAGRSTKRVARTARKAKQRQVTVERVDPIEVLRRDGWTCKKCTVRTPQKLRGTYHPRAPEVDHIVPLSKGGEHSYRNTQCLCRSCNLAKGDGNSGQLRLFG